MRHKGKRRDDNHQELANYAVSLGMSFLDTSQLNNGLDGLVGFAGVDVRVEIKDGNKSPSRRKLTDSESRVLESWNGRSPVIWESKKDVEETRAILLTRVK